MKLAYIKGFSDSGKFGIEACLKECLPEFELISYELPTAPRAAIEYLREQVFRDHVNLLIGWGLGAYYVLHVSGCLKIAIDPPFDPNTVPDGLIGREVILNDPGKDGTTSLPWKQKYHDQLMYYNQQLIDADFDILDESRLFFSSEASGTADRELFESYWTKYEIPGGPGLTKSMLVDHIIPMIRKEFESPASE